MRYVLLTLALVLAACSDTLGPTTEPEPVPSFRMLNTDGNGNGGGGCTRPTASVECALRFGGLVLTGGTIAGSCVASWTGAGAVACAGLVSGFGGQAQGYLDAPDCRACPPPPDYPTIGPSQPWNLPPMPPGGY